MKMKKITVVVGVLILAAVAISPLRAAFTPQDKEELHQVIHDYLIENPEVIKEAIGALQKKEQQAQVEMTNQAISNNSAELFNSSSPKMENPNAKITIVEFFDYRCHYCKKAQTEVHKILSERDDVQFIYKELPILGEVSLVASKAALASMKQNQYVNFHNKLMSEVKLDENKIFELAKESELDVDKLKKDMNDPGIENELAQNSKLAQALRIRGTPAFIVALHPLNESVKPVFLPGAIEASRFNQVITDLQKGETIEQ